MIDPNLLSALARDAEIGKDEVVLEIGTGTGRLTEILAAHAGFVLSIEIDDHLARIAGSSLAGFPNVEVMNADILDRSGAISPSVSDRILSQTDGRPPVVAANLPYSVSGRIIAALMLWEPGPARALLTVQKEVGERLTASPGTRAFGKLSVLVQSAVETRLLRTIPPDCFWPRPAVDSAVVRLGARKAETETLRVLSRLASGVFQHRRKTIRNALREATNLQLGPEDASAVLARAGIEEGVRADSVTVGQFERLAALFSASARSSGVLTLKKLDSPGSSRLSSSSST
jgi:16S rRNA (adenine1518-N6/adenine1519-N6)-dimethyltransferase